VLPTSEKEALRGGSDLGSFGDINGKKEEIASLIEQEV
jgi:hypothetical protein